MQALAGAAGGHLRIGTSVLVSGQQIQASIFWALLLLTLSLPLRRASMGGRLRSGAACQPGTAKDMCALLPCAEVFPGAKHFSERKGQPPYVEAYDATAPTRSCWAM
jgi:transcriptional regulator of nitric oxide reductase